MDEHTSFALTQDVWNEISRHAREAFPDECCGVILSTGDSDRVHALENIQNQLHALDPQTYPRTAASAYAIYPLEHKYVHAQRPPSPLERNNQVHNPDQNAPQTKNSPNIRAPPVAPHHA